MQTILLIAITNIDVLIATSKKVKPKTSNPNEAVIPISIKITETIVSTIGVNIPKPICGKIFFLLIKSVRLTNLGVSHKQTSHIRIAVARIVPKDIR